MLLYYFIPLPILSILSGRLFKPLIFELFWLSKLINKGGQEHVAHKHLAVGKAGCH